MTLERMRSILAPLAAFAVAVLTILPCQSGLASPPTMKAVVVREHGGPASLKLEEVPRTEPKENEVLVRVIAAGVNPIDAAIREGTYAKEFATTLPLRSGYDIAGVAEKTGAKVTKPGLELARPALRRREVERA